MMPAFVANCSTTIACHGQMHNAAVENLYLGSNANDSGGIASVYAGLVSVPSAENPSMNRVTPGDLENSFLWHKVSGDQNMDPAVVSGCQRVANGPNPCSDCIAEAPCGIQMPFTGTLEPSVRCLIQRWIANGAKNN
jgi:hypothetical protein